MTNVSTAILLPFSLEGLAKQRPSGPALEGDAPHDDGYLPEVTSFLFCSSSAVI